MVAERAPVTFGRKLREARERRGIPLRQIASATKISVAVLEALERNDISRLPGGIFGRAFVRSYAVEVGLDPEQTIQDFIAQFPHDSVTQGHSTHERVEDHESVESERRIAATVLRLVLVSIPVAAAVIYFGTQGATFLRRQPPAPLPQPATEATPPKAFEDPPPTAAAPDKLIVGLAVKRPLRLSLTVDGQKTIDRLVQAGETETIDVTKEMELTVDDAAAVVLTLNGVDAKPLGKSGETVTARLNRSNFKDYQQPR